MNFFKMNFRSRVLLLSFCTGLAGGSVAIAYRWVLEYIESGRASLLLRPNLISMAIWLAAAVIFAFVAEFFVKKDPLIGGSGIPQVKAYLINQARQKPVRGLLFKFAGGAMGIFNGLSLGREGPSIQLGSLAGQLLGERFGETELERRTLVSAGASVGLAAAFNAPLAGVLFALEELYRSFSPLILLACTLSAVTGTLLSSFVYGFKPIFPISISQTFPIGGYWHLLLIGALCGLLGKLFNLMLVAFSKAYSKLKIGKVLAPTLLALPLMLFFPLVLGGGHKLIETLLLDRHTVSMLLLLLGGKMLFTFASYGTGVPGGIFLPMLSIGAVLGSLYFQGMDTLFGMETSFEEAFILFGMVGLFTAVVRAPLTGIVLLVEMSRSVPSMLPLAVVAFTAYLTAEILDSDPVYEILLKRLLEKQAKPQKEVSEKKSRYGRTILELNLPQGSAYSGKTLSEIRLPASVILVSLIRGEEEFPLRPDTVLYEGDLVIAAVDPNQTHAIQEQFAKIGEHFE